jgi:hypothetical protein
MLKRVTIIFSIFIVLGLVRAQNSLSVQGALGFVTIDDKIWGQIALRPVFPLWKFRVALDLFFYIDQNGNIHQDEWNFSTDEAIKNTLIDKILFIQFGKHDEPVYLRLGMLDRVTLGYGALVFDYTNGFLYPQSRKIGLENKLRWKSFEFEAFANDFKENLGLVGIRAQTGAANLFTIGITGVLDRNQYLGLEDSDYDGRPDLVDDFPNNRSYWIDSDGDGLADNHMDEIDRDGDGFPDIYDLDVIHAYWDALGDAVGEDFSNETYYDSLPDENVELKNEPLNVDKETDAVAGFGLDIGVPIMQTENIYVGMYSQYLQLVGETTNPGTLESEALGSGLVPAGLATRFGPLSLNLEYRMVPKGNFEFEYWNRNYEITRSTLAPLDLTTFGNQNEPRFHLVTKESGLGRIGIMKGYYGRVQIELGESVWLTTTYQNLSGAIWKSDQRSFTNGSLRNFLAAVELARGIGRIQYASAYYQQRNVPDPFKFNPAENTVMGYNFGVKLGLGILLNYTYKRTYRDNNGDGDVNDTDDVINIIIIEASFGF